MITYNVALRWQTRGSRPTHNIDRLAKEGMKLTGVTNSVYTPSRAVILRMLTV